MSTQPCSERSFSQTAYVKCNIEIYTDISQKWLGTESVNVWGINTALSRVIGLFPVVTNILIYCMMLSVFSALDLKTSVVGIEM